jgi:hypothetical protein
MTPFLLDPMLYVRGQERERAVLSLRVYFESFTGRWFEVVADPDPFSITASDIVAVSMLGVDVPARTSVWLLGAGRAVVRDLLRRVPVGRPIWDDVVDLSKAGAAWRLWDELIAHHDMGATTTSKLLAAKRPHLVPVQDSVVTAALLGPGVRGFDWWALWRARLQGPEGEELQREARSLVDAVPEARHLSMLRTLDVVVWMRERGWRDAPALAGFADAPPVA